MLAWGVTAIALLALALLSTRTSREAGRSVAGPPRDRQQIEREKALERELLRTAGPAPSAVDDRALAHAVGADGRRGGVMPTGCGDAPEDAASPTLIAVAGRP